MSSTRDNKCCAQIGMDQAIAALDRACLRALTNGGSTPDRIPGEGRPGAAESPVVAGFRRGFQAAILRCRDGATGCASRSARPRPRRRGAARGRRGSSSGVGIEDGSSALTLPASPSLPWSAAAGRRGRAGAAGAAARAAATGAGAAARAARRDGRVVADRLVRLLLLRDRRLQRAQDVVVRARVGLHVGGQVLERVLVAMHRIGLVDPAVVPVVQEQLPARRRRLRGCRPDGRGAEGERDERPARARASAGGS